MGEKSCHKSGRIFRLYEKSLLFTRGVILNGILHIALLNMLVTNLRREVLFPHKCSGKEKGIDRFTERTQ